MWAQEYIFFPCISEFWDPEEELKQARHSTDKASPVSAWSCSWPAAHMDEYQILKAKKKQHTEEEAENWKWH